ncbi:MAG: DNA-processing protein DprA [Bacteroidales bacterium]|nr:DNA-processing protein DprA [Bacteroidales bacterium]
MIDNTLAYWMALAHAPNFSTRRKMEFLIESAYEKYTIQEALTKIKSHNKLGFNFTDIEWAGILESVNDLANYAFLAEQIEDQGIHTMNIWDIYVYPDSLKQNLKKGAPLLIYAKGNMDLLKKESIAIVGARKSSDISLKFTENLAKMLVKKNQVVVSGFAKGVDKMALESALEHNGQSIIVLPQGIETYKSKTYYQDIVKGNVLVMSIYHPKAPWSVGFAMHRNTIIYGLADQIYVAESNSSGGTWEGALDGLKRDRKIFVRKPESHEKNANELLIQKGATPVDFNGNALKNTTPEQGKLF